MPYQPWPLLGRGVCTRVNLEAEREGLLWAVLQLEQGFNSVLFPPSITISFLGWMEMLSGAVALDLATDSAGLLGRLGYCEILAL